MIVIKKLPYSHSHITVQVPSKRLDEIMLKEIMSEDLVTVEEDFNSRECAKLMVWMVAHILPL